MRYAVVVCNVVCCCTWLLDVDPSQLEEWLCALAGVLSGWSINSGSMPGQMHTWVAGSIPSPGLGHVWEVTNRYVYIDASLSLFPFLSFTLSKKQWKSIHKVRINKQKKNGCATD